MPTKTKRTRRWAVKPQEVKDHEALQMTAPAVNAEVANDPLLKTEAPPVAVLPSEPVSLVDALIPSLVDKPVEPADVIRPPTPDVKRTEETVDIRPYIEVNAPNASGTPEIIVRQPENKNLVLTPEEIEGIMAARNAPPPEPSKYPVRDSGGWLLCPACGASDKTHAVNVAVTYSKEHSSWSASCKCGHEWGG